MSAEPQNSNNLFVNVAGAIVAVLVVGLLWFVGWSLVFVTIPAENQTTLAQFVGMVGTQVGIVVGWYYGTSSAQKRQGEIIATQAATASKLADTAAAAAGTTTVTTSSTTKDTP